MSKIGLFSRFVGLGCVLLLSACAGMGGMGGTTGAVHLTQSQVASIQHCSQPLGTAQVMSQMPMENVSWTGLDAGAILKEALAGTDCFTSVKLRSPYFNVNPDTGQPFPPANYTFSARTPQDSGGGAQRAISMGTAVGGMSAVMPLLSVAGPLGWVATMAIPTDSHKDITLTVMMSGRSGTRLFTGTNKQKDKLQFTTFQGSDQSWAMVAAVLDVTNKIVAGLDYTPVREHRKRLASSHATS